jgi:hypothetical protein
VHSPTNPPELGAHDGSDWDRRREEGRGEGTEPLAFAFLLIPALLRFAPQKARDRTQALAARGKGSYLDTRRRLRGARGGGSLYPPPLRYRTTCTLIGPRSDLAQPGEGVGNGGGQSKQCTGPYQRRRDVRESDSPAASRASAQPRAATDGAAALSGEAGPAQPREAAPPPLPTPAARCPACP